MRTYSVQILAIACAAIVFGACNPLDVDTPRSSIPVYPEPDYEPSRKISLLFVIDASLSMRADQDLHQTMKAARLTMRQLTKYDEVGVMYYSDERTLVQPLIGQPGVAESALDENKWPPGKSYSTLYKTVESGYRYMLGSATKQMQAIILVTDGCNLSLPSADSSDEKDKMNQLLEDSSFVPIFCVGIAKYANLLPLDMFDLFKVKTDGKYYVLLKPGDETVVNSDSIAVKFSDVIHELRRSP